MPLRIFWKNTGSLPPFSLVFPRAAWESYPALKMSGTGKGPHDDPVADVGQIELTIERLRIFIGRYEKRERARLEDAISGSSRIALLQLLEEAKGHLPLGAIYKAVDERLMDPEAGSPDFRP